MLEAIVKNNVELNKFLKTFQGAFINKAQFRHFQHYVIALMIYLGSKNLSGISRAIPDGRHECSLYRFLSQPKWDMEQVKKNRLKLLNRKSRRALEATRRKDKTPKVYLIIDDSLVEKTGKKMEGVAKHRSHKEKNKPVLGHVWVTAQLVVAGYSYPLDWAIYRRQSECEQTSAPFISKPDIAYNMIQAYQPLPDTQTVVMTDSWYVSQDILALCKRSDFQFIGAVKSNRKVKIGSHNQQVKQWRDALPKSRLERVKVKDTYYKGWINSHDGMLSCGQTVKVLINRRIGVKKWHYLISTDLTLSAQAILASYFIRWEVENFYRAAKQILGWGDYQMRNLVAIENHVLLMMVTHAYLEIQRRDALEQATEDEAHFTLGDLQRQHQRLAQRSNIALVFALTQQGYSLDDIYDRLAA
jgi:SRSO17 transposase